MLYRTKYPVCRDCNLRWWFSITLHWALTNWSRWAYGHDCFLCQLLYRFLNPLKDCHNICDRLKHKLNAKNMVIKNITKSAKYEAEKPIRKAKPQYQSKLKNQFSTFNTHVVWQGLLWITRTSRNLHLQTLTPSSQINWITYTAGSLKRTPPKLPTTLALSILCT